MHGVTVGVGAADASGWRVHAAGAAAIEFAGTGTSQRCNVTGTPTAWGVTAWHNVLHNRPLLLHPTRLTCWGGVLPD
jgi:hypothetical protein